MRSFLIPGFPQNLQASSFANTLASLGIFQSFSSGTNISLNAFGVSLNLDNGFTPSGYDYRQLRKVPIRVPEEVFTCDLHITN